MFTDSTYDGVGLSAGRSSLPGIKAPIKLAFHCDSSSHRGFDYMVAGGLAIRTSRYADIATAVRQIKTAANIKSEMKWSEFKGGHRTVAYEAIVDLFFSLTEKNQAHFHCLIAKFSEFSHASFGGGKPESSVNRMYFQLLLHRVCRFYGKECYIYCYPDKGNDGSELSEYVGVINHLANRKYRTAHKLVLVEQKDSKLCEVTQMIDIIIGGIACHCNDSARADGHKQKLARYILKKAKLSQWLDCTPARRRKFTIWLFKHRDIRRAPHGAMRSKPPQPARPAYSRHGQPND